jgi:hypothetical protein
VGCAGDTLVYVLARTTVGCSLLRYSFDGDLLGYTDLALYLEGNSNAFAVDAGGNAVLGGSHDGLFNMTKVQPNGNVLWSHDFGYPGLQSPSSSITNIVCDANGNVYGAGSAGNQQFGVLTKFTPQGTQSWTDTTESFYVNSYLARNRDRLLLDGDQLTLATFHIAAHLYAYDTLGNRLFRQALEVAGVPGPRVNAMRKDAAGDLYITGFLPSAPGFTAFLAKFTPDIATGVLSVALDRFAIYPDPCDDRLRLEHVLDGTPVRIDDMNGRLVQCVALDGSALDVSTLLPGPYVLRLPDGRSARFVKAGR